MTLAFPNIVILSKIVQMLGWIFVTLKIASAIVQIKLLRGNYRLPPQTLLFRTVYVTGKITPSLTSAAFCIASALRHDWLNASVFGLLAILITALAVYVVRLRQQGKFFGLLDLVSKKKRKTAKPSL